MRDILGVVFATILSALGLVYVVSIFWGANGSSKIQDNISQLSYMQGQIASTYNGYTYATLSNDVVIKSQLAIPQAFSTGVLLDPWQGAITVTPDANPAYFDVTEAKVPNDACIQTATKIRNYLSLQINGGTAFNAANPIDPGAAKDACNSASDSNTLSFVFGGN